MLQEIPENVICWNEDFETIYYLVQNQYPCHCKPHNGTYHMYTSPVISVKVPRIVSSLLWSKIFYCHILLNITSIVIFRKHLNMHLFDLAFPPINQISIAPISLAMPGSVAQQPNQCSTAKLMKQFHSINRPSGVPVSKRERPSQGDVSWDVSGR